MSLQREWLADLNPGGATPIYQPPGSSTGASPAPAASSTSTALWIVGGLAVAAAGAAWLLARGAR